MTVTTIKVSTELRDRLKEQARAENSTIGAYLEKLLERELRAHRFEQLREAMSKTTPEEWQSCREETEWWDRATEA